MNKMLKNLSCWFSHGLLRLLALVRGSTQENDNRGLPVLLALVPGTMYKEAEKLSQQRRVFTLFAFASDQSSEIWENISKYFYEDCRKAKVVVLNDWLRMGSTGKREELLASYQAMAEVAEKIQAVNPTVKIFAFPTGGVYDALVHKISGVKKIFSWYDPILIEALKA